MSKFSLLFLWRHWNLQYGCRWSPNTAAVDNNKRILRSTQNTIVIFTFKVVEGNTLQYDLLTIQTPSFGWSFQDARQLASKPAHHKQWVARSSPNFQNSATIPCHIECWVTEGLRCHAQQNTRGSSCVLISVIFCHFYVTIYISDIKVIYTGENKSWLN